MEDVDMPGQNKLFTNKSLCPYYKKNMGKKQEFRKFRQSPEFVLFWVTQFRLESVEIVPQCP